MTDKKPKQFPKDEIQNEKDRVVKGWISVEVKDSQGDIMPMTALRKTLNTWMDRGGNISDMHSNKIVGKALRWYEQEHPETKRPGILIDYKIFDDYTLDDEVWEDIKANKRTGLSFGGRSLDQPKEKKDDFTGEMGMQLGGLEAFEMASVDDPANEFAKNVEINYLAKSKNKKDSMMAIEMFGKKFKDLTENEKKELKVSRKVLEGKNNLLKDFQKGFQGDITKPFAGFKDFDQCLEAQREKHSEESAKRICGFLQARSEDNKEDKKKQEEPYGPHTHEEENPEGLHTHLENKLNKIIKHFEDKTLNKLNKNFDTIFEKLEKKKCKNKKFK